MSHDDQQWEEYLDFAVTIAREAGEITLSYFRQPFTIETKRDGSFVTNADREAEAHLRRRIQEKFPADAILGEEEGEVSGSTGRRWIIDPIDGTYSFVHGVPFFGVLLAVEVDRESRLGVINLPATGDLVYAARGRGCFWNGERSTVSNTAALSESLLLSTDFGACDAVGFGSPAARLQGQVKARRTWGDCYGHMLVATGRAEVMLDPVMNVWDCAALAPVVEEAGGTFTDWQGNHTIHGGNAISTNGVLFNDVMGLVRAGE